MFDTSSTEAATDRARVSGWLNAQEFQLLEVICDTFFPSLPPPAVCAEATARYYQCKASDLGIAQLIEETLGKLPAEERESLRYFLLLFTQPASSLVLTGTARPFRELDLELQQKYLRGLAQSPIAQLRQGYQVLKRLTSFLFFTVQNEAGENPAWPVLDYQLVGAKGLKSPGLQPLRVREAMTLECDIVVVGSGAGGGVIAGELARSGKSVIVLEQGEYYSDGELPLPEAQAMSQLYLGSGALTTEDLGIVILAGSTLGGGTVVNWCTSLRPDRAVLEEWSERSGLPLFSDESLQQAFTTVEQRLNVNSENSAHNPQNQLLFEGARALGYHADRLPRNAIACQQRCGACGFGCGYGCKQAGTRTYLQDAAEHGARMLVETRAQRIIVRNGRASGVIARARDSVSGETYRVVVQARAVAVAAGALNTPALLLRSGIENPHIGQHLHLHPTAAISAFYPEEVYPWQGIMQSAYSREFAYLHGNYGYTLEVPPAHPGLLGMATPWSDAQSYRASMARASHAASFIVLTRDKGEGRVVLNGQGEAVAQYVTSVFDRRHLLHGMRMAARIHVAAGAREIFSLQSRASRVTPDHQGEVSASMWRDFDAQLERHGMGPNKILLFSAHQMGSCRMGREPGKSVVDESGQVHGIGGLYICDSSVFPAASGVNPMLSVMALAYQTSRNIRDAL